MFYVTKLERNRNTTHQMWKSWNYGIQKQGGARNSTDQETGHRRAAAALTSSSLRHADAIIRLSDSTTASGINASSCGVEFHHKKGRSLFPAQLWVELD